MVAPAMDGSESSVAPEGPGENLEEAEEKYRTLVEQSGDAVIILQDGELVYSNQIYLDLFGWRPDRSEGQSFLDGVPPEHRDEVREHYECRLKGEPAPDCYEMEFLSLRGERIPTEIKPRVIRYRGRPATMVTMRDITERKEVEEKAARQQALLEALSRAQSQFIALTDTREAFDSLLTAMLGGGTLTLESAEIELDTGAARALPSAPAPGSYVVLRIRDTGVGMSTETLERIFEPFFTSKNRASATGLGLATVHGIVPQSGGAISVESAPGAGSCFEIYLPSHTEIPSEREPNAQIPLGSARILLVEDESPVRDVMRRQLKRSGYTVVDTGDSAEALKLCSQATRLLVVDMVMPKLSGRDLANQLSAKFPDLKVLLVSGYSEDLVGEDTPKRAFLAKPFTRRSLIQKVHEVLDT